MEKVDLRPFCIVSSMRDREDVCLGLTTFSLYSSSETGDRLNLDVLRGVGDLGASDSSSSGSSLSSLGLSSASDSLSLSYQMGSFLMAMSEGAVQQLRNHFLGSSIKFAIETIK